MKADEEPKGADDNKPWPFPTRDHHPPSEQTGAAAPPVPAPTEAAIDHGLEESFPASDPVSVTVAKPGRKDKA